MESCFECFEQAGVDLNSPQHGEADILISEIKPFCHVNKPYLFDLLLDLISFMRSLSAPGKFNSTPLPLTAVVAALTSYYLTQSSASDQRTSSASWWQTHFTAGAPIPTEYLSQLPLNWPYTAYNSAGKILSWPFVNPSATSQTVAWLYHSMLHNPRPIFTPKVQKSSSYYNPLLENWTRSFVYDNTPRLSTTAGTAPQRAPFSPTITQAPVMSLEPDTDAERRSQDGIGTRPTAAGPGGRRAQVLQR
jgi:hypothetical protein